MTPVRFRLKELLESAGLSQSELSRQSGVSLVTINRMSNNATAQVSLRTLDALARVLDCAPGEIIDAPGRSRVRTPKAPK